MSASTVQRSLRCPACGRAWQAPLGTGGKCPGCGVLGTTGGVREGSRGGNVRDLDTARSLQDAQPDKARWADAIDEQIRRTLLATAEVHANDLDEIAVPAEHCNLIGTRIAWWRNKHYIAATGELRRVEHRAANGRKTSVYRVTDAGRAYLTAGPSADASTASTAIPGSSADVAALSVSAGSGGQRAGVGAGQYGDAASRVTAVPPSSSADPDAQVEPPPKGSPAGLDWAAGEPAQGQLVEMPSPRPRSAVTDPEAA